MEPEIELEKFGAVPNDRPSGAMELQLRCLVRYYRAIAWELKSRTGLPWRQRFKAWSRGFSSHAWQLYDLEHGDPDLYLPDIRSQRTMYKVNGFFNPILGNKLVLSRLLDALQAPHPEVVSILLDGQLLEPGAPPDPNLPRALSRTLERHPRQVFRPTWAGSGQGVFFLNREDDGLRLNGRSVTPGEACTLLSRLDRYMSTRFQEQAAYSRNIYPGSTNTLRIVTLWDAASRNAVLAAVSHRFGLARSGLLDRFHGGLGGICTEVSRVDGTLGPALMLTPQGALASHSHHPDTGAPIQGVVVPGLRPCLEEMLATANEFPYCPWIGWDVVMTDSGYSIIEANTLPAFSLSQAHTPLLKDPRTRQIFQRWGLAR